MNFKEIKELSGMSLAQFSRYFRVPYRTVQNWSAGVSKCPPYLLDLFVYRLRIENVIPADGIHGNITPAVRIMVDVNGNATQSFAEMYHALQRQDTLLQLSANGDTGICVICERRARTAMLRLLHKFGEIIAVDDINAVYAAKKQRYADIAVIDNTAETTV